MSLSITSQVSPLTKQMLKDSSVTSTVQKNVLMSDVTVYFIQVDNTQSSSAQVYLRLWDHKNPVTGAVSPTEPDYVLPVPAESLQNFIINDGLDFLEGLSYSCTQNAVVTDVINPSKVVAVKMIID
jgi:hypothetical protein